MNAADALAVQICSAGEKWSDLDAAANLLEETKATLLADLMRQAPEGTALGLREIYAKSDATYKQHIEAMVEARRVANRARVRYQSLQVLADLRRTQESTRRAELRALGG
jgi:hypothetical protein